MSAERKNMLDRQVAGHARAEAEYIARVRAMSVVERARLLEAACRAAALAMHDRAAAGAPPIKPVPWPQSTWEFLRKHARVRNQSTH